MTISNIDNIPSQDDPTNFDAYAFALFTYIRDSMVPGLNALQADVVQQAASAFFAMGARDAAQAAANFKGVWANLTGAISIPASVYHQNAFWILTSNLANVASSEPGSGGVWQPANGLRTPMPVARPSLVLDFAAAQVFDPRISFSRSTPALLVNRKGLLESVAANVPRITFDAATGECLGYLREDQRTNTLLQSKECDTAISGGFALGPNMTRVGKTIAPDGTNTATVYTTSSTGNAYTQQPQTFAANTTYTVSVYAKLISGAVPTMGSIISVDYDGNNNSANLERLTALVAGLTTSWKLFTLTFTNVAAIGGFVYLLTDFGNGAQIAIAEAQCEVGGYATSRIRTTTAAVTRSADVASMSGAAFNSWFRADQGTLVSTASSPAFNLTQITEAGSFGLDDGTTANALFLRSYSGNGSLNYDVIGNSNGISQIDSTEAPYPANQFVTHAVAYALNDAAYSRDGSTVQTQTPYVLQNNLSNARIGNSGSVHIKRIAYYPQRVSNAQLQSLTA